jgi:ABC-2 type transport system ATP-binding protein
LRVRTGLAAICQERGTTLLVTSHNMVEVERIAERVVFLSDGRVVADGPPAEVAARFGRDDLEEVFLHLAAGARP